MFGFAVFSSQQLLLSTCQWCLSVFTKSPLSFVHNAWQNIYKKIQNITSLERSVILIFTRRFSSTTRNIFCFSSFFSAFAHYHFACDLGDTASIWEPTQRAGRPAPWPGHSVLSTRFSEDKWRRGDNNGSSSSSVAASLAIYSPLLHQTGRVPSWTLARSHCPYSCFLSIPLRPPLDTCAEVGGNL